MLWILSISYRTRDTYFRVVDRLRPVLTLNYAQTPNSDFYSLATLK